MIKSRHIWWLSLPCRVRGDNSCPSFSLFLPKDQMHLKIKSIGIYNALCASKCIMVLVLGNLVAILKIVAIWEVIFWSFIKILHLKQITYILPNINICFHHPTALASSLLLNITTEKRSFFGSIKYLCIMRCEREDASLIWACLYRKVKVSFKIRMQKAR